MYRKREKRLVREDRGAEEIGPHNKRQTTTTTTTIITTVPIIAIITIIGHCNNTTTHRVYIVGKIAKRLAQ